LVDRALSRDIAWGDLASWHELDYGSGHSLPVVVRWPWRRAASAVSPDHS